MAGPLISGAGHEPRGCLGGACPRVGPLLVSRDGDLAGYRARLGFAAVWAVSGGSTWGWVVSAPQVHYFPGGGFVVHKLGGFAGATYSAWFDAAGTLLDAEGARWVRGGRRRTYPIRKGGPIWRDLSSYARRFLPVVSA